MTITFGPLGILGLISAIAIGALSWSASKEYGWMAGFTQMLGMIAIMILWLGIAIAKFFAWMGWL